MITSLPTAQLRELSPAALEELGQQSLREHLRGQATVAQQKYGPLTPTSVERLLQDPDCLRHPVRLVFEYGEMAPHQFAQPELDWREPDKDGRILYLHPRLRDHFAPYLLAVAYMIPVINYGEVVGDSHCLHYGATLLGLMEDEFYQQVCSLAEWVGAEPRFPSNTAEEMHRCGHR